MVKLSGLGTFSHQCTVSSWRPIVRATIDLFGPERSIFGSNFPMIQPAEALKDLPVLGLSDEVRADFLSENARRVFRL